MADIKARLIQLKDEHNLPIVPRVSSKGVTMSDGTTLEEYIASHTGLSGVVSNTTAGWAAQPSLVALNNTIYVYVDYKEKWDGNFIPGLKFGDGETLLKDIPFVSDLYQAHIENEDIHVSETDRTNWDGKINVKTVVNENVIFTRGGN